MCIRDSYIGIIVEECKFRVALGTKINNRTYLNTMLFVHDQEINKNNECKLQRSMFRLCKVCSNYIHHENFCAEEKTVAFVGKYPLQTKIVLDNKSIEKVPQFRYLGCDIQWYIV